MDLTEMYKRVQASGLNWVPPIYDRKQSDLDYAKAILEMGYNYLDGAQKVDFLQGLKGCFNYTDMYRIFQNCMYLGVLIGIEVTPAGEWDMRHPAKQRDYMDMCKNVSALREAYFVYGDTEPTPNVPINSWQKVNVIEKILYDIFAIFQANYSAMKYTGEQYAGGIGIL